MPRPRKPFTLHLFRNNNIQRISAGRLRMDHNATIPDRMVDFLSDASSLSGFVALQQIGQVVKLVSH
ncbi:MAG TPA: hypothetical protein ENI64_01130 [Gammaproteobacteria bacterium]|nr:hypothetical protein [Gammaproteobacteria bacterium]